MRKVNFHIFGLSAMSQSRNHDLPKLDKESAVDYDKRTWRDHLHVLPKTNQVFIPQMAMKFCLAECAKFLSIQIPGKGKSTYTKHFDAGLLSLRPIMLYHQGSTKPFLAKDAEAERIYVNSDGVRGSGKRVWRTYPKIENWCADVGMEVLDDTITAEVFQQHLMQAGQFIGLGRFRPRNGGYYGRFSYENLTVEQIDLDSIDRDEALEALS